MPETLIDRINCSGFSGLARNLKERALYSNCRSGPRWYYDAFRFDEQGQPWLYKTLQVQDDYSPDYPYVFFPLFEKTFDQQGKVVASRATFGLRSRRGGFGALIAGCARDDREERRDRMTPTTSPMPTASPRNSAGWF